MKEGLSQQKIQPGSTGLAILRSFKVSLLNIASKEKGKLNKNSVGWAVNERSEKGIEVVAMKFSYEKER